MDTVPLTEPSDSNSQLPSNASTETILISFKLSKHILLSLLVLLSMLANPLIIKIQVQ